MKKIGSQIRLGYFDKTSKPVVIDLYNVPES